MATSKYDWRCLVCGEHNVADIERCKTCDAPNVINGLEVDARKAALERGEKFSPDIHYDLPKERTHSWWERVSLGENETARTFGRRTMLIAASATPFMMFIEYSKRPLFIDIIFRLHYFYFSLGKF